MPRLLPILCLLLFANYLLGQQTLGGFGIIDIEIDSSILYARYMGKDSKNNMYVIGNSRSAKNKIIVKRFLSDGSTDYSYGENGIAFVGKYGKPIDINGVVLADSKVLIGGRYWLRLADQTFFSGNAVSLICLNESGQIDLDFGNEGGVMCQSPGGLLKVSSSQALYFSNADAIIKTDFHGDIDTAFNQLENNLFKTAAFNADTYRKHRLNRTTVSSSVLKDKEAIIGATTQSTISVKYDSIVILKYNELGRLDLGFGEMGRKTIKVKDQNILLLSLAAIGSRIYVSTSVWGLAQPILYVLNDKGELIEEGELNLRKIVGFDDDTFVRGGLRGVASFENDRIGILSTFCGSSYNQYQLSLLDRFNLEEHESHFLFNFRHQCIRGFEQIDEDSFIFFSFIKGFLIKHRISLGNHKARVDFYQNKFDLLFNNTIDKCQIYKAEEHGLKEFRILDLMGNTIKELPINQENRILEMIEFIAEKKGQYIIEAKLKSEQTIRDMLSIN